VDDELSMARMSAPVAALALLLAGHPGLPAPCIGVSSVYPDRLSLSFHDVPGAFDAWLTALRITPAAVTEKPLGRTTWVLHAATTYGGAHIQLTDYTTRETDRA
jgi:hypothetical protein